MYCGRRPTNQEGSGPERGGEQLVGEEGTQYTECQLASLLFSLFECLNGL